MENILLVDDDTDLLLLLKRSLTKLGFQVTTLSNPALVQQTIETVRPVVVLLDINMGEWDGRDICKYIKSLPGYASLPIILCSAMVDGSLALESCKADLFLPKPLTGTALAEHIKKLTRN